MPHLVRQILGEGPHPAAGVGGQDLLDGLQVDANPAHVLVVKDAGDLVSRRLE